MADENQANGNQNTGEQRTEEAPPWAKELQATFKEATTGISTLVELARQSQQRPQEQEQEEDNESDNIDDMQLETMPRKAFAERLLASFESTLDSKLGPLTQQLSQQQSQLLTSEYVRDAEKFAARTPDFAEWSEEMQVIAKDNPELSVRRIYAIAKDENPEKAAKMAEKYKKNNTEEPPPQQRRRPLSLSPGSNSTEERNQRMSSEDSAKAAWEDSVSKFGNVFAS